MPSSVEGWLELKPRLLNHATTFGALRDRLTWPNAAADEGMFRATTLGMSDDQAAAAARLIYELYVGLTLRR
ncbi:MAG: hypothetical protein ACXVRK_03470 [Gaiellaceae bacterium]